MEHVKKMVLVDPRVLEDKSTVMSKVEDTIKRNTSMKNQVLSALDHELNTIMQDITLPDDEKIKLYQNTLQRFLAVKESNQQENIKFPEIAKNNVKLEDTRETESTSDHIKHIKHEIIDGVPKKYKRNASVMLNHIEAHPNTTWNDRGEFVYKGNPIKDSNIFDLVVDILRKRKNITPTGWVSFTDALKAINIPLSLVGNVDRLKHMNTSDVQRSPKRRKQKSIPWETLSLDDEEY